MPEYYQQAKIQNMDDITPREQRRMGLHKLAADKNRSEINGADNER
jgi:hypothetical protein